MVAFVPKVIIASGSGFAFAKQGNKMRRLRHRTSEGVEVWVDGWAEGEGKGGVRV